MSRRERGRERQSILDVASTCTSRCGAFDALPFEAPQLIAFSNKEFYQGDLIISHPRTTSERPCVKYHPVGGEFSRTSQCARAAWCRCGSGSYGKTAERIPRLVTLNFEQANSSKSCWTSGSELNLRPRIPGKDEQWPEPFFVKNLENVQATTDVMFISATYGPDAMATNTSGLADQWVNGIED